MPITMVQERMVKSVFENNLGESMENIIDNHPKVFDFIKSDNNFIDVVNKIYKDVNKGHELPVSDTTDDNKNESYINNTNASDMLTTMMETIHTQQEINVNQEKKITEVNSKVDDLVKFIKDTIDHPESILQSLQSAKTSKQVPPIDGAGHSEQVNGSSISGLSAPSNNSPAGSGFTMDKIGDILNIVMQLKGMNSQQKVSEQDPLSSMTNGLQMATQLAGALGGALSKMFDAFDGMQNKAYNSWGKRFSGRTTNMAEPDSNIDIEELSNKIVNKIKKGES